MPLQNCLKFETLPSKLKIIKEVEKITSLHLHREDVGDDLFWIIYNGEKKVKIFFLFEESVIEVYNPSLTRTYLFFSVVHSLENLGGGLLDRKNVPKWKGKKWKERKIWDFFMKL